MSKHDTGADLIHMERLRQISDEGWDAAHDARHTGGDLAVIAATLACDGLDAVVVDGRGWRGTEDAEWRLREKHGGDRIRLLTIAGALIAAEIDRLILEEES